MGILLSFIENIQMKTQEHQPVHMTKKGQEDAGKKKNNNNPNTDGKISISFYQFLPCDYFSIKIAGAETTTPTPFTTYHDGRGIKKKN